MIYPHNFSRGMKFDEIKRRCWRKKKLSPADAETLGNIKEAIESKKNVRLRDARFEMRLGRNAGGTGNRRTKKGKTKPSV